MYTTIYAFTKTVILTVEHVDNLARVIVYPFAIKRSNVKNDISLAPMNTPPMAVCGPKPETAYFAHVTPCNNIPNHWRSALNVNNLYVQ